MNSTTLEIFLVIGGVFSFLGAIMAYLITYREWEHHYQIKKEPRKIALEAAIFTFLLFFILMFTIGLFYKP